MGRSAPSVESHKIITAMEDAGAEVTVIQEDVAEYGPLEKMFSRLAQQEKNLRGIIHCAGTLDDGILLQQNWKRFRNVMRAKVDGSWNLHLLSQEMDLDFFVLFSSGAAFLGSAGQGNHATANAFMDALAHYRCAHGLPALSINWGAWSQIGAATRGDVIQRMQMKGMGLIQPDQGFHVLRHLLATDPIQVGVLPIHWPELFGVMGDTSERRTFERFEEKEKPEKIAPKDAEPVFLEQLRASTPGRWNKLLLERLQQEVCKCLGFDIEQSVDTNQPLNELGLDSLMAVELRNVISLMVDAPLPATLLFNYPSMGELVHHLSNDILPSKFNNLDGPFQEMITKKDPTEADDLEHYSEEEIENLLLEKLKSQ
jgi:acyl carrier protein